MRRTLVLFGALGGLAISKPASALPLASFSASVSGLYGNDPSDAPVDSYFLGLGAQAGVTLWDSLYLGASLQHFFGTSEHEQLDSDPPVLIDRTATLTELIGHVGYDWSLDGVRLRPTLGAGFALNDVVVDTTVGDGELTAATSEGGIVLTPGLEASLPITGWASACLGLRYDVVLRDGDNLSAIVLALGLGINL